MNINTRHMTDDELKAAAKDRALAEGLDLTDPKKRYTIWSENGFSSPAGEHLLWEGSAANAPEKEQKVRECVVKTGYSRTIILAALQDQIEVVPPRGEASAFGRP